MSTKIAIVGMEAVFGPGEGLDAFDRRIFDGIGPTAEVSQDGRKRIRSGPRSECKEGYLQILDRSASASGAALLRRVVEGALQSTLSGGTERDAKNLALIVVSEHDGTFLETGWKRLIRKDSVFLALETAQGLLAHREVDGVVIGAAYGPDGRAQAAGFVDPGTAGRNGPGRDAGEGAAAVCLKRLDQAEKDQERIFATIDAIAAESPGSRDERAPASEGVTAISRKGFRMAGVRPREIACLEASGFGVERQDPVEIQGLIRAYRSDGNGLTCALGNVKVNVGECSFASGLASVIKAALCLYHRYIPATPGWTGPRDEALWEGSPFYVPTESRPWFVNRESRKRVAAVSSLENRTVRHLILSEDLKQGARPNRYLAAVSPYCFPLAGDDRADLVKQLEALNKTLETSSCLAQPAKRNFVDFLKKSQAPYALMIMGHTREDLSKEILFIRTGVPGAFEKRADLKTPKGSYFTANPLGEKGKVAFVYPGVGSAYVGLGRSLFHLFPELHDRFSRMIPDVAALLKEEELYPRTRHRLSEDEIWKRELGLRKDIMTIAESGMGFFTLYTMILKDSFGVTPHCALGYSMGEPGMIASLGVWEEPGQLVDRFHHSPAFRKNLGYELAVVRRLWNLPEAGCGTQGKIWDSFTLQASPDFVSQAIAGEERVFLTIINAPEEVVIAGDPESCKKVIRKIGCKHYPLSLNLAIHCDPARMEYDRFVDLYTLPVIENPGIKFYSSSCYKPIPLRSKAIAHSIAKAFSETVDFPRLVNQAHEDGARLFIELGSRKFCCNLIDRILEGKDHLAVAVNVKGTRDEASLVRVLAQLVSHRVPVDLSPLF